MFDRGRKKGRCKKMQVIDQFFVCGHMDRSRVAKFRCISRYAQDSRLFNYICDCYTGISENCQPEEKATLDLYMKKLFKERIHALKPGDQMGRCQLINNIYQCRITSDDIRLFLLECGEKTPLEQMSIDLQKEAWQIRIAK